METEKKMVSFSQLAMYQECNYRWYLSYVEARKKKDANINLIFGSAMHSTLQAYLKEVYTHSAKKADSLEINKMLKENMTKEFISSKSFMEEGQYPCTKEELQEFYLDGIEILDYFKKHRDEYFSKKGFELIGIEIPLDFDLQNNVSFRGYIDIVILDAIAKKYKIIDLKTSTNGWKDFQKNDFSKISQVILYKKFYSQKFNVEMNNIEVEFIILKRKLYENVDYPQKRIQRFSPSSGTQSINKVMKSLEDFINNCFLSDGTYNKNREYLKTNDEKKCRFCEFNNTVFCNRNEPGDKHEK